MRMNLNRINVPKTLVVDRRLTSDRCKVVVAAEEEVAATIEVTTDRLSIPRRTITTNTDHPEMGMTNNETTGTRVHDVL